MYEGAAGVVVFAGGARDVCGGIGNGSRRNLPSWCRKSGSRFVMVPVEEQQTREGGSDRRPYRDDNDVSFNDACDLVIWEED